ncbi:MAG: GSCFA domain-containing protein [Bacteroidetes bacterium]|nr:GSCFA domain-containing protein [Bacteroidota bacterium]
MGTSKFQTIVDIPKFDWETGYSKKNIFMGSCFTENVGNRMSALKYNVDINPFGILYNPISVANGIRILLQKKEFKSSDLIQHSGLWHSFYHHGKFSFPDENKTLEAINSRIKTSAEYLKTADSLFITFGTAWIYKYKTTGTTVSNCHKIPSAQFERVRLSVGEIVDVYQQLMDGIWELNPALKVVFTVSPIRHWKDGAIENQRSKATLLLAIDEIIKNPNGNSNYFPSYEIVMDELRDYRFYAEDMLHVSDVAINHIWEKFEQALISEESQKISKEVKKIKAAENHRPFNKFTKEHLTFLQKQLSKLKLLEQKYPVINLELEKQTFMEQINKIENSSL